MGQVQSAVQSRAQDAEYLACVAVFMQRYKAIIPDWQACLESLNSSPVPCCWANTLKISRQDLLDLLQEAGYQVQPLGWHQDGLQILGRAPGVPVLGRSWLYLSGLLQIQEQASMLAGSVLQAKPGEMVLDLCAAPGGKTAQIATAMGNQGTLIANDRNYTRMRALGQITKRLGLMNVSCTLYDGANYPVTTACFDRVLVDAPCSCQGTTRKRWPQALPSVESPKQLRQLARVQAALLRKAVLMTKPGGTIVYSTCTYAPEENEAVVDEILRQFAGQVQMETIMVPGFEHSPGLTAWQGQRFSSQVAKALRIWPMQNNSGGFFVARLRKLAASQPPAATTMPCSAVRPAKQPGYAPLSAIPQQLQDAFIQRFGLPQDLFVGHTYHATKRGWYMLAQGHAPPPGLRHDASGLFLIKSNTKYPKLTTTAAMLLGQYAQKHIVVLTRAQVELYLRQKNCELAPCQLQACSQGGYVLVRYHAVNLGLGLICLSQPKAKDGKIRLTSLFPQSWQGGD